jgi:uncharacterized protein
MYPLLFLVGFLAGLVDSIAGGGGLITVPVLLGLGFPPQIALGTNKLQASFGSTSAAWHYARAKLVNWRECRLGIVFTAAGALVGAMAVQRLSSDALQALIPWALVAIVIYTLARKNAGAKPHPPRAPAALFFPVIGLALGFYDGFLGPGTGSFWTALLIVVMGYDFLRATAVTKVMNATSNVVGLSLFVVGGAVYYPAGLVMGAGQLLGARVGSRLAVLRGSRFVRPIFLTMVTALLLRLIYVRYVK